MDGNDGRKKVGWGSGEHDRRRAHADPVLWIVSLSFKTPASGS